MTDYKTQLILLLKDISLTMELSNQEKLSMSSWLDCFINKCSVSNDAPPSCGYAACVIGDHIMRTKNAKLSSIDIVNIDYLIKSSINLALHLDELCVEVFGNRHLVKSIYESHTDTRGIHSELSMLFHSTDDLDYPHLVKEYPTALDAKNYIDICISKVEKYTE